MGISFSLKGDFIKKDEVFALQKEVERRPEDTASPWKTVI